MAEILDDGIKLSNDEAALCAAALSASLFMILMNTDFATQMLSNVITFTSKLGSPYLNKFQTDLGVCVKRVGGAVKHVSAKDVTGEFSKKKDSFDPWE